MINLPLPPGLILILGAALIPFLKGRTKSVYVVALPVLGFLNMLGLAAGFSGPDEITRWTVSFMDYELVFGRIDRFSLLIGHIFSLLTVIAFIYILHTRDNLEYVSGMVYSGSALGVVFAGDMLSFFVFWETLTLCAVGCTLARRTDAARRAGFRYLLFHIAGGVVLLAGVILLIAQTGSARFTEIGLHGPAGWMIFIGFGVNCAWPLLHGWIPDTYPQASVGGVIFMATFTTKTAVYALARAFPGESSLVWIGVVMVIFPLFYAVLENDLRKVLSYSLINQVGFMVIGVGIGSNLSLNGTGAHAYCHILYKALLFMSIGAVIHQTGKSKATELGGLVRSMPLTCLFCCIGAAAASALPLFCGFVSKSMIISAAANEHRTVVWFALLFASVGVVQHAGIKVPYCAFFGRDSGIRVKEAPTNMLVAMGIAAFLCISVSLPLLNLPWVGYGFLHGMLPFEMDQPYAPYTFYHVNGQLLLVLFAALAFGLMRVTGIYRAPARGVLLDVDRVYRSAGTGLLRFFDFALNGLNRAAKRFFVDRIAKKGASIGAVGPAWVAVQLMWIFWEIRWLDRETVAKKKEDLYQRARDGVFPIGITAFLAVVLMAILIVL